MNGHLLTHRSTKPFACHVEGCGKSYCDARSLRRHKENHHGQAKPESKIQGMSTQIVQFIWSLTRVRRAGPEMQAIGRPDFEDMNPSGVTVCTLTLRWRWSTLN